MATPINPMPKDKEEIEWLESEVTNGEARLDYWKAARRLKYIRDKMNAMEEKKEGASSHEE